MNGENQRDIFLTVYHDAVKAEVSFLLTRRKMLGWFRDEMSAVSAALEHILMGSSSFASSRRLPTIQIHSDYSDEWIKRPHVDYRRATRIKFSPEGRRVVRRPGSFSKAWMGESI